MDYRSIWAPESDAERRMFIIGQDDKDRYRAHCKLQAVQVLNQLRLSDRVILDYGAGAGGTAKLIAEQGYLVIALDCSPAMLVEYPLRLITDGRSVPLPAACIDFCYSFLCFQHMRRCDVELVVSELNRVLISGGRFFYQFSGFGDPDYSGPERETVKWELYQLQSLFPGASIERDEKAPPYTPYWYVRGIRR